jgi:hypothetical protein
MLTLLAGLLAAFLDWLRGAKPPTLRPPTEGEDDLSGYDHLTGGPIDLKEKSGCRRSAT